MEHLSFLGLALIFVFGFVASHEQLAGAIEQLRLLLAQLDRLDGVVGGIFLGRFAATDRLHGDPELAVGTMGGSPIRRSVPRLVGLRQAMSRKGSPPVNRMKKIDDQ